MVVKKTKKRVFAWKPIVAVSGAVIGVFVVIFFVLYFANKPNYRDLEKEFERISANISADWQLVSESSNKGTWGLFCLGVDDSSCPNIGQTFSSMNSPSPSEDKDVLEKLIRNSLFIIKEEKTERCNLEADNYFCGFEASRNEFGLTIDISKSDKFSEKHLSIFLGQKSDMAIQ